MHHIFAWFELPYSKRLTPMRACDFHECNTNYKIELKFLNIFQIFILSSGMITLLRLSCLYLYNRVRYVCFTTNLSQLSKKNFFNQHNFFLIFLSLLTLELLVELENTPRCPFESTFWKVNQLIS